MKLCVPTGARPQNPSPAYWQQSLHLPLSERSRNSSAQEDGVLTVEQSQKVITYEEELWKFCIIYKWI